VAPNLLAYAREAAGSFSGSLMTLAGFALVTALLAITLRALPTTAAGQSSSLRVPT
jgi:hypothetical protein